MNMFEEIRHFTAAAMFVVVFEVLFCAATECPRYCTCESATLKCSLRMPTYIPQQVIRVDVREVQFGDRFNFTDTSWTNVTHLAINAGSSVQTYTDNGLRTLYNGEFDNLRSLEYLKLTCSCLEMIEENAFDGLNKLKVLDLSGNGRLGIPIISNGLKGRSILPNLSELYLSNISYLRVDQMKVEEKFYAAVKYKPLKVLDISNNAHSHIYFLDIGFIESSFQHLEKLNISNDGLVIASFRVKDFPKLNVIDMSYISAKVAVSNCLFVNQYAADQHILLPDNLTEIYVKKLFSVTASRIHGISNSSHICLAKCSTNEYFCLIGNSTNFKKLVISENSLLYFDLNLLHPLRNVEYLDLSKNLLGNAFAVGNYLTSCLDSLVSLEVLILSENDIKTVPYDSFRSSRLLRILNLSKNKLETITFDTSYFLSLETLDISNNKITFLGVTSIEQLNFLLGLQNVKNHSAALNPKAMHTNNNTLNVMASNSVKDANSDRATGYTTAVKLKGNPFLCSCDTVPFLKWLLSLKESYSCTLKSETRTINQAAVDRAQYLCIENIVIAVCSFAGLSIVVSFMIAAMCIIRRRKRQLLRRQVQEGIEMFGKKKETIPVFLSFCSEDKKTVMDDIFPQLDLGLKEILQTESRCVATGSTDFRPGLSVADEIIRCVETASVVVFFVTDAFCKKMWCRNEALVAHYENKPTILMLWENVNVKLMPKHMYKHFQLHTRVHWVEKEGKRVMMPDWKILCEAIVRLFRKNTAPI